MVTGSRRRYRLLEKLGEGGFGAVYRAEMAGGAGFTKQVAIKLLHDDFADSEDNLQRLRDEARILGLVRHPAIVGVDNLTRFEQGWAVIMEFVPGADLDAMLKLGRLPARIAVALVEEVASALHVVHEDAVDSAGKPLRILHRDIKPSNIRLTAHGEVKILDFGIARGEFASREARTSSRLLGSFAYMPTERLDGVEGPGTDIYALGLIFAQMIAAPPPGEPPRIPRRYRTFLDDLSGRVATSLSRQGLASSQYDEIVTLIRSMAAYEIEERPPALEVVRSCRRMCQSLAGPSLRDWAAETVPLITAQKASPTGSDITEITLEERDSSVVSQTAPPTDVSSGPSPAPSTHATRLPLVLGGLAAVAVVGAGIPVLNHLYERSTAPASSPGAPLPPPARAVEPAPDDDTEPSASPEDPPAEASTAGSQEPAGAAPSKAPATGAVSPSTTAPTPAPDPAPAMASVQLEGDARSVWFTSDQGRYPAGALPPGRYDIQAWFSGPDPVVAGTMVLHGGESARIRCVSAMARCVKKN